jgi:hypothetical protein
MKDIGIYYKSSTCGMFLLYYILGSETKFNVTARNKELDYGTNKKLMTSMFYTQFRPKKDIHWISGEYWPDNLFADNDLPKFYYFQIHDFAPHQDFKEKFRINDLYKKLDCIKINPYIADESKWFKLMFYKRSGSFHDFPKQNVTFKEFYKRTKLVLSRSKGSKLNWCDYNFDILKFLVDKQERIRLCNYIGITINETMEEFVEYYVKCHEEKLLKKLYSDDIKRPLGVIN